MTAEEYILRLVEISEKKLALIHSMHEISVMQKDVIEQKDTDKLDELLAMKQNYMDRADKLDEQFNVYFLRVKSLLGIKSFEEISASKILGAAKLKEVISEIMTVLSEIMTLEKQNRLSANEVLNTLGKELKNMNTGKKFNKAYQPEPSQNPSIFIDKKN